MTPSARLSAAIAVLDSILDGTPAETALTQWARASRFAGSGDRLAIRDLVFQALRQKRSAAAMGNAMTGRGLVLGLVRLQNGDVDSLFSGFGHAPARVTPDEAARSATEEEALDCPDWLAPQLRRDLGPAFAQVMTALQSRARVFARVNTRKTTLQGAVQSLAQDGIRAMADDQNPTAIEIVENARKINVSKAYLDGLVELQDLSSQSIIQDLPLRDGQKVLDLCAGSGGKTLAMANRADARFYAHDHFPHRLRDLPDRAKRAGIGATILTDPAKEAPFDLVLCDVPCSGSGSWRRDPQGKWALTQEKLIEICALQAEILDRAVGLVQPDGVICYATCSVLRVENEDQINAFVDRNPDWSCLLTRKLPVSDRGDGFFVVHLQRTAAVRAGAATD